MWVLHEAMLWLHTAFTAPEALVIHSSQLKHWLADSFFRAFIFFFPKVY